MCAVHTQHNAIHFDFSNQFSKCYTINVNNVKLFAIVINSFFFAAFVWFSRKMEEMTGLQRKISRRSNVEIV